MDSVLKPIHFDTEPNNVTAGKQWTHWIKTFENFLVSLNTTTKYVSDGTKLFFVIKYVAPLIYKLVSECQTYADAVKILKDIYVYIT